MSLIENYLHETPEKMSEIVEKAEELFNKVEKLDLKKVVITGSGTSYHAGLQIAPMLRKLMNIEVVSLYPFMITKETFLNHNEKTLVIGISQGGSSFSTYEAMKIAKEAGCLTASMAGLENAYIDEQADYVLTVHCGEELAGAKTKGYYCTKLNLLLFGLYWGLEN
ncbi:SIS domain-containing protein, partial [Carnobacterium sp.]|uniref:SIS domain-containing protein n=1 Tax=Carnobacterium sp. TaxID=48221 RepID=UPI0028AB2A41